MLRTEQELTAFTRWSESGLGHRGEPRDPCASAYGPRAPPVDAIIVAGGFAPPETSVPPGTRAATKHARNAR
jgi:hypothetical protein